VFKSWRRTLQRLWDPESGKMAAAKQESAQSNTVATLTGGATKDNLPVYSLPLHYDLSRRERFSMHFRATFGRLLSFVILFIGHKFQTLEGRGRIYQKSYPSHSHLKHRFIPPPKESDSLPPLFLDIHGGGFLIGDPWNDDEPNLWMSLSLNCLVVSLNYTKAPAVQFPTPMDEIIDTVLDILGDESLRFDRSRVVIGGYSAGGNLCLVCNQ
jgi:acetyl esterase/lipase